MESSTAVVAAGAAVNVLLVTVKCAAGLASHSPAMVADAMHSLFDLVADAVTFWAVRASQQKASREFPYGRGKFEAVCAVGIGLVLVAGAVGLALEMWDDMEAHVRAWAGLASSAAVAAAERPLPSPRQHAYALAAACLSLVCKESLFRIT